MTTSKVLPPPTATTPLPIVTVIASTLALLLPLAAIAIMYGEIRFIPSDTKLSAVQKLRELQAAEQRQLTTYDWIEPPAGDRAGVVRIPISRARELILKEASSRQKESR